MTTPKKQRRNAKRTERRARARGAGIRSQLMIMGSKLYGTDEIARMVETVFGKLGLTRARATRYPSEVLVSLRPVKVIAALRKAGEPGLAGLVDASTRAYRCSVHPGRVEPLCAVVDGEPGTFILGCPLCSGGELRSRWEAEGRELVQSTTCTCFEGRVEGGVHVEVPCDRGASYMVDGNPYELICESCVAKGYADGAIALIPLEPADPEGGAS